MMDARGHRKVHAAPSLRLTGASKNEGLPKAPPSPWPSRISNPRSFHWMDTDPWLQADCDNGPITFSPLEGTPPSFFTGHSTILIGRETLGLCLLLFNHSWESGRDGTLPRD